MNLVCDLTQFVLSSVVQNINADILAKNFMDEVAPSFRITELIVVDEDS